MRGWSHRAGEDFVGYTPELRTEVGVRGLGLHGRGNEERELSRSSGLPEAIARGGELARDLVAGLADRDGVHDDWFRGRLEDPRLVVRPLGASGGRQHAARRIFGSTGLGSATGLASTVGSSTVGGATVGSTTVTDGDEVDPEPVSVYVLVEEAAVRSVGRESARLLGTGPLSRCTSTLTSLTSMSERSYGGQLLECMQN